MLVATSSHKCSLVVPLTEQGEKLRIVADAAVTDSVVIHPEGSNVWIVGFDEDGWDFSDVGGENVLVALRDNYPVLFEEIQSIFEDVLENQTEPSEREFLELYAKHGWEVHLRDVTTFNLEPYTWVFSELGELRHPIVTEGHLTHTVDIARGDYIVSLTRYNEITGDESRIERLNRMPIIELWRYGSNDQRYLIESSVSEHVGGGDLTLDSLLPKIGDTYYNEHYYYGSKELPTICLVNFNAFLSPVEGTESRRIYSHTGIPLYLDHETGDFILPKFIETGIGLAYTIEPEGLVGTVEATRIEGAVSEPIIQLDEELTYGKEPEELEKIKRDIVNLVKSNLSLKELIELP